MELSVKDLACARGGVPVLTGVNFALGSGKVLVLRGPNGSGKTTLLRTISGLQPPLSGLVNVPGDAIAYGGHADGLKSTLSVADNLLFWSGIYGSQSIDHALQVFDLVDLSERPAQNLSAGQKRRLGLARLLVTGRPIWVLDEPTVSLDAQSVAMFGQAIAAQLESGGAALIATHINLGITADVLDVSRFRATQETPSGNGFDEVLL